jgi:hypothetical protein
MKEYAIIVRESKEGVNLRIASLDEGYPQGFRSSGTLKAESQAEAVEDLQQRIIHDITERWVSL